MWIGFAVNNNNWYGTIIQNTSTSSLSLSYSVSRPECQFIHRGCARCLSHSPSYSLHKNSHWLKGSGLLQGFYRTPSIMAAFAIR